MSKEDTLYEQIIEEYKKTGSVKQVAEKLNSNTIKVRRVLITEGLWTSKSSIAVGELYAQGLSVSEIAEKLVMSEKNVQSYLPYTRGSYGGEKSSDAERSGEYRERMHKAAAHQVSVKNAKGLDENPEIPTPINTKLIEFPQDKINDYQMPAQKDMIEEIRWPSVLKLRLELVPPSYPYTKDMQINRRSEDQHRFLKFAKAENGIIREVLVPGEMNLHAMHYMIQKLFGWQNSHLHNFLLSDEDFERITEGQKISTYLDLCGSIFRFPSGNMDDRFWDDDYMEGISFKTWLRSKYQYGFQDDSVEDTFISNHTHVQEMKKEISEDLQNNPNLTIKDLMDKVIYEDPFNYILEKTPVRSLFRTAYKGTFDITDSEWKCGQMMIIDQASDILEDMMNQEPEEMDALQEMMKDLSNLRGSVQDIDQAIHYGRYEELKKFYKMDPYQVIREQKEMIRFLEDALKPVLADSDPVVLPFLDELLYEYDYGDGWTVRITCLDAYTANDNYDVHFLDDYFREHDTNVMLDRIPCDKLQYKALSGETVTDELREKLQHVYLEFKPLCTLADGLNVMDDVGGIYGYADFLDTINGDDPEEKKSYKEWARGMGWTGRRTKPENIL